jgi:phage portal protein BeeE
MAKGEIQPSKIGVSQLWDNGQQYPTDLLVYPIYPNFGRVKYWNGGDADSDGVERCILHVKDYHPSFQYYGFPSYFSAILYCELEYRIAKYNQSQFNNGFMPSGLLQVFGIQSQEEADAVMLALNEKFTGTGNNSKLMLQVVSDPNTAAKFVDMGANMKEGSWLELAKLAQDNIIKAHEWNVALGGIETAGSLGSNQQIRSEADFIQNTVIKPIQNQLLSQWLNKTLPDAAKWLNIDFGNNELDILNNSPVSFSGDIVPSDILTINEQREILGYAPIDQQPTIQTDGTNTN